MKVLVVDDSKINREAALAQLKGHDVVVAATYDEGRNLISGKWDEEKYKFNNICPFDVVLCDLLMPASGDAQGRNGERFVGQEMPVGIFLALLAAKNGAKYVALFTDSNHHDHPASACLDPFNSRGGNGPFPMSVNEARVILVNDTNWVKLFYRDDLSRTMSYDEFYKDKGKNSEITVSAKSWVDVFNFLVHGKLEDDDDDKNDGWR